tara:strand:- start:63 stop:326 length:264 start_codon:yes stop_codon:yes gene_type:complete
MFSSFTQSWGATILNSAAILFGIILYAVLKFYGYEYNYNYNRKRMLSKQFKEQEDDALENDCYHRIITEDTEAKEESQQSTAYYGTM